MVTGMNKVLAQHMITVTPRATRLMADYFKDKEKQPVRIFVRLCGCGIRTFDIALEQCKTSDRVFEIDGFTYIIKSNGGQMPYRHTIMELVKNQGG